MVSIVLLSFQFLKPIKYNKVKKNSNQGTVLPNVNFSSMWNQQTTKVFWNRWETCVTGWQEEEKSSETKLRSKLTTEIGLIKANPIKSLTNVKLGKESIFCKQHYCCDPQLGAYLMPVSWPPTFLHLIMLILVRIKRDM